MVPLGQIAKPILRPVAVTPGTAYRTLGVKWWGGGAYERATIDGSSTAAKTLSVVRADDLIINKIWVRHGSTAVATASVDGCAASGEFPTFRINRAIAEPRWLHWQTQTPEFWGRCDALSQGTSGKNRIQPERFLTIQIPLPPIGEQRRIVARIDALAAKIAEAGLCASSAAETSAAIVASARRQIFDVISSDYAPRRLSEVADCRLGKMLSTASKMNVAGAPYLRNANVQNGTFDLTSIYTMDFHDYEKGTFELRAGDLMVNEGGFGVGRCAVWNAEISPCYFQKSLHRVRVNQDLLLPRFLMHQLSWANESGRFADITMTTTFQHLTGVRLKRHGVYVVPLRVQESIVTTLDGVQTRVSAAT